MRGISREVLARSATEQITNARCASAGDRWNGLEAAHEQAVSPVMSADVVREVQSEFCEGCPAVAACARWAQTEEYSGLAAGAAYVRGNRKPMAWVSRRPGRVRAEQAAS